jgi:hypothetical protein
VNAFAGAGILALWASLDAIAAEPPPRFTLVIDTSGAEAVLAAATADAAHAEALAATAAKLPPIQAMIAKEHKYVPEATPESFRAAIVSLAGGGRGRPYALDAIRADPALARGLIDALKRRQAELNARLVDRLKAFSPPGTHLRATLAVVLGSHQNGWAPDQLTPVFYIDAGFASGDLDGLIATAAHELFHLVQGAAQPDWNPAFAASTSASAAEREAHNLHAAFLNLVLEGMAEYVGDPNVLPGSGPMIVHDRKEYARNLARAGEIFALIDSIVFRTARDPDASLGTLLSIGFGGSWDQTGYYVGYRMAKAIDRYLGRERLQALVALPPEDFVVDYATVAAAHPSDPEITPLAPSTLEAAQTAKAWFSRCRQ